MKKLLVGLGNPGSKYEKSRHNVGFILINKLVDERGLSWKEDSKFNTLISHDDDFIYIKPLSFMNNSGNVISKVLKYFDIDNSHLIVIHDEIDLEFLKIKVQKGSGSAGNNGVQSIIESLGTKDFWRVRIGVGRPSNPQIPVEDWVLSTFTDEELKKVLEIKPETYINSIAVD